MSSQRSEVATWLLAASASAIPLLYLVGYQRRIVTKPLLRMSATAFLVACGMVGLGVAIRAENGQSYLAFAAMCMLPMCQVILLQYVHRQFALRYGRPPDSYKGIGVSLEALPDRVLALATLLLAFICTVF